MEELLQSVDILGLKVMISMALRQCFLEEIFEVIFHMEKKNFLILQSWGQFI